MSEAKDLDWLKERVISLFQDASAGDVDHAVCVKYAEILMKLLPGGAPKGSRLSSLDADVIEQVRLAVQMASHTAPP